MFERLKEAIRADRDRKGRTTGTILESGTITAFSAGSAGAVAAVVTTPVDVVKTRIMLSAAEDAASEAASKQNARNGGNGGSNGLVDAFGKSVEATKGTARGALKSLNPMVSPEEKGRKSAWRLGKQIVAEQGMKGLWRGGALRAVWTFVGSGLYLGVYESGRVYLAMRRGDKLDEGDLM